MINKTEAIYKLNSSVVSTTGDAAKAVFIAQEIAG